MAQSDVRSLRHENSRTITAELEVGLRRQLALRSEQRAASRRPFNRERTAWKQAAERQESLALARVSRN